MKEVALSAMIGVVSGTVAWITLYRLFAPRLRWDGVFTKMDRGPSAPERYRYAMRFMNGGWWRTAVVVHVQVRGRLPAPTPDLPNNHHTFEIPTDTPFVPEVKVRRRIPGRRRGGVYAAVLRLQDIASSDLRLLAIPAPLRTELLEGRLELERLFDVGLTLRFFVWGTDAATGSVAVRKSERIGRATPITVLTSPHAPPLEDGRDAEESSG